MPKLYLLKFNNTVPPLALHLCVDEIFFWLTKNQVNKIFSENAFDAVMHFVVVAYVGVMV
jgi:hypothetical protein